MPEVLITMLTREMKDIEMVPPFIGAAVNSAIKSILPSGLNPGFKRRLRITFGFERQKQR